jgi:UDP-glucose 4-epimerase
VGVAHVKVPRTHQSVYFKVNRDLAVDLCKRAKSEGVRQYIYFSSMNVYGDTSDLITEKMKPQPRSAYGLSKLQADKTIMQANSDTFKVVSIRPPVVYGYGCKGNYPRLSKIALRVPVFPAFENTRSMIYIGNLCELVRLIIDNDECGIFHPQNSEYTSTAELVAEIAKLHGRKVHMTRMFNYLIRLSFKRIRIINRAFADDRYAMALSNYKDFAYCLYDFEESIKLTEGIQ